MNKSRSKDELFEEIRQEHQELRESLGELNRMLADRLEAVARVAEMVSSLGEHVETHFDEEETAGLFDDIVERAPRLSDHIAKLRADHQQLLTTVRQLKKAASEGDGSTDWWENLEKTFHEFSKDLMHHENAENDILLAAYTDDIGAGD